MKKLFIISAIAMSGLIYNTANAQIGIHIGFGLAPRRVVYAPQPVVVEQAPVYDQSQTVYDNSSDDYYYLPDVDAYYDVNDQCYYYYDGNDWISAAYLPGAYSNYDWRNSTRYEIRASRPYLHDDVYRSRYNGHQIGEFELRSDDNHYNGYSNGGYKSDQHFDNRGQGGYNQVVQPNRERGGYNQHFDNRGQGGYNQPSQPNRGQGGYNQPSNRDDNRSRDTRGGGEHFSQNSPQRGYGNHRMTKF